MVFQKNSFTSLWFLKKKIFTLWYYRLMITPPTLEQTWESRRRRLRCGCSRTSISSGLADDWGRWRAGRRLCCRTGPGIPELADPQTRRLQPKKGTITIQFSLVYSIKYDIFFELMLARANAQEIYLKYWYQLYQNHWLNKSIFSNGNNSR